MFVIQLLLLSEGKPSLVPPGELFQSFSITSYMKVNTLFLCRFPLMNPSIQRCSPHLNLSDV